MDIVIFRRDSILPSGVYEEFLKKRGFPGRELPGDPTSPQHPAPPGEPRARHSNSDALRSDFLRVFYTVGLGRMRSYVPMHVESERAFGHRAQGSFTSQRRRILISLEENPPKRGGFRRVCTRRWEPRLARSFGYLALSVTRGRDRIFAVSSFLPNLTLTMIKTKLSQDSKTRPLLHDARALATCPVVHKWPKSVYFFKIIVFLLSISSLSCLDLWTKGKILRVISTRFNTRIIVTAI